MSFGSHRSVTNRETILNWLSPLRQHRDIDRNTQSFCEIGLLVSLKSYSLRGRLLIYHIARGQVPERAMAPHSSTLSWEIPWMEEPGRPQSMGSLRVRHD